MSIEVGVLLTGPYWAKACILTPVFWHLPPDRSAGYIPDSRKLWEEIWDHRLEDLIFAHSHPGRGHYPGPSSTDVTTFAAIEAALGRRIGWFITNETHLVFCIHDDNDWVTLAIDENDFGDKTWLQKLRDLSYEDKR